MAAVGRPEIGVGSAPDEHSLMAGVWPNRRTNRYLSALKDLQQVLGALHDATVAEKLVAHLKTAGASDANFATAPVNHWLINCQRSSRKEAIGLWGRFAKRKLFWENT